jgi:hypothetical protein
VALRKHSAAKPDLDNQAFSAYTRVSLGGGANSEPFMPNRMLDVGLKSLAALANLKSLNLRGTVITDAGIKSLAALEQLKRLDLSDTKVTDVGVKELTPLKNLIELTVDFDRVSFATVDELRISSPDLQVWFSSPSRR